MREKKAKVGRAPAASSSSPGVLLLLRASFSPHHNAMQCVGTALMHLCCAMYFQHYSCALGTLVGRYLGTCSEVHMGACSTCGLEPDVALRRHVSEEPVCGNYPTYVARQQFVPYCPNYLLFAMWISSGQWSSINLFFGPVLLQCF